MWDKVSTILAYLFAAWLIYLVVCVVLIYSGLYVHFPEEFFYGVPPYHGTWDADITCPGGY